MKLLFNLIFLVFASFTINAQTFTGGGGSIPDGTGTTNPVAGTALCVPVTVTGVGAINGTNGLKSVCININHPFTADLIVFLKSPDGTTIPLTIFNGDATGALVNYTNTCFSMTAASSISAIANTNPYTGNFIPDENLGWFNNGQNANGVWNLCVVDYFAQDVGTLLNFNITFGPTPAPPLSCNGNLYANNTCTLATPVCNLNGYCGNTSSNYSVNTWPELTTAFTTCTGGGVIDNNSFIQFVASAATVNLNVNVTNSQTGGGIQMMIYSGGCGSGAVTTYGCNFQMLPGNNVVTATGLTPGNTYYLMIDGFSDVNGPDVCDYTITATSGINIFNVTPTAPSICSGTSVTLTASGGNGTYTWSPATGLNTTTGATVIASPTSNQTYTVTTAAIGSLNCPLSKTVTVTVNAAPAAPTASVTVQPTCATPTGTIVITAPTGANLQYSINGTAYQASTTFTGVGAGTYNVTVKNTTSGCISPATVLTVNAAPGAPAAPTASVTVQPTCATPTGTIVITAPTGANLEYSINGTTYQAGTTFTGVGAGTYNVTVRNTVSGCTSTATVLTVNAAPGAPAAPTASVTVQPSCSIATGTIVITAPTGANLEYSINGTTYQVGTTFTGVTPGTYNVTVRNAVSGCTSTATVLTVNAVPTPPAAPTASVTVQPTCITPTGTIVITAPTGANLEYSINGSTYQTGTTFTSVGAGTYNVTVRNTTTGCVSTATVLTVNAPPGAPAAPTASVTVLPTCAVPTGTIVVSAPTGANLEYSINGTTYQTSTTFAGLAPATYPVTVRNSATGCVSSITSVTVNAPSGAPAAPTASVTVQPTCTVSTGTIVVTAPTGVNLQYSINGTVYQAGTNFTLVGSGTYNVTVKDIVSGCVSSATVLTVNPAPTPLTAPTASVTVQPTCAVPNGTIVITAPIGANLQYSINGTTYQSATTYTGLTPATYNVTVKNTVTGCISTATVLIVNAVPTAPPAPTATLAVAPNCLIPTGTILVSSPTGANLEFSIDGITYQSSATFTGLIPGIYGVRVRNTTSNCISPITNVTVTNVPPKSPTPVVVSPIDYCVNETASALSATGFNLLWYSSPTGGIPSPVAPVPSTGSSGTITYYVTQVNLPNCESDRVPIVVIVNPLPSVNAGPDKQIFSGQSTTLNGTAAGSNITYVWTPSLITTTLTPVVSPLTTTTYTLTVTSDDGCINADDVTIKVINEIIIPNTFSPNGDNINDKWVIKYIEQYPNCGVEIFNRYGQQIFKSTGYTTPWDGTIKGKPLPVGTYYYILNLGIANRDVLKGSITIIR